MCLCTHCCTRACLPAWLCCGQVECGSQFTSKLEGMFKDMDLSADVMTAFRCVHYPNVVGHEATLYGTHNKCPAAPSMYMI